MGIEEFFSAIRKRCSNDEEYAAELLKARGFLLEDNELALSDNSHHRDEEYLHTLLQNENLGSVKDGKIILSHNGNIENIFFIDNYISFAVCNDGESWGKFIHNSYVPKIPTGVLEPFVARYVKAISACRVQTHRSCDGNHPERCRPRIYVECDRGPSSLWHQIICDRCLSPFFKIRWNSEYSTIRFNNENKWRIYAEFNRAAGFLYDNRIVLRQVRQEAVANISHSMAKHMPEEELTEIFTNKANELLDKCRGNLNLPLSTDHRRNSRTQNT